LKFLSLHGKNGFAEKFKILAGYRLENFVELSKYHNYVGLKPFAEYQNL